MNIYLAIAFTSAAWIFILTRQDRRPPPTGPVYKAAEPRDELAEAFKWN
jgi:hypothetical protein